MGSRAPTGKIRLQKFLSDSGVASRRHAEELIRKGRVLVNDDVVDELPAFVDPHTDRVVCNGAVVKPQPHEYFICHKPPSVVCTNRDSQGRVRAVDLLPPMKARLVPVGRLDVDSSGLLLMTNDGDLVERMTHPRFGVPKIYRVEVRGRVADELPNQLREGVFLAEGKARADDADIVHRGRQRSVLNITLREGRNRQIRRMLAKLGYKVKTLKRVQVGRLSLKRLPLGAVRRLTPAEMRTLREDIAAAETHAAEAGRKRSPGKKTRKKSGAKRGKKTRQTTGSSHAKHQPDEPDTPGRRLIT